MSLPLTATLFYKSSYAGVVSHFNTISSPTPLDVAFTARALLALEPPATAEARSLVSKHADIIGENSRKAFQTFSDLTELVASSASSSASDDDRDLGNQVSALTDAYEAVIETGEHYDGEQEQIEVIVATAQHLDQDPLGALETLQMGKNTQRNLGSLALGIHLLLLNHRLDLAQKEYEAARQWADDSLVIQLIEASLGLQQGGRAAQQAYYVFDEFASLSATANEAKGGRLGAMKLGRGVALMKRGEWTKAEESVREASTVLQQQSDTGAGGQEAIKKDVQANLAVLAVHLNPASKLANAGQEHISQLSQPLPAHQLKTSLAEMDHRFDELVAARSVAAISS
ncbi:unnamed protein product [Parajaminaea phylloscopi]